MSSAGTPWPGIATRSSTTSFAHSHMDGLTHFSHDGKLYNGVSVDVLEKGGARKLGIQNAKDGIFTRGVLVDIPWLRGVEFLEPGTAITSEDLEAWEAKTSVKIGSGDVLLIRTGRWERVRQRGQWNFLEEAAGSHASLARWLKARDVAVIGSDGASDALPSRVEGLVNPLHTGAGESRPAAPRQPRSGVASSLRNRLGRGSVEVLSP